MLLVLTSILAHLFHFSYKLGNPHNVGPLLQQWEPIHFGTFEIVGTEVIWTQMLHNSGNWFRCCNTWNNGNGPLLEYIVEGVGTKVIVRACYNNVLRSVILDTIVAFDIPLKRAWFKSTAPQSHGYQQSNCSCDVKNTFGVSLYSKEYTFPIMFRQL
jgi:hypothetical protein